MWVSILFCRILSIICEQNYLSNMSRVIFSVLLIDHWSYRFTKVWIPLRQGVLVTILCDKVCQWLAADQWFSLGTPVSSANKAECHDIAEILLKVPLNTITITAADSQNVQSDLLCYMYLTKIYDFFQYHLSLFRKNVSDWIQNKIRPH